MKKILFSALTFFVLFSSLGTSLPVPGATPGSAAFGFEKVYESIALTFTGDEKKEMKKMRFAQERLAEAEKLASQNRSERAVKALQLYRKQVSDVKDEEARRNLSETGMQKIQELNDTLQDKGFSDIVDSMTRQAQQMKGSEGNVSEEASSPRGTGFMATGRVVQRN